MNVLEAMDARKSVRSYLPKGIESAKVDAIVRAGNAAANAGEIYLTVITNQELLSTIGDVSRQMMLKSGNTFLEKTAALPDYNPVYNAPVMIVISASGGNDAQGMNVANAACAGQNMLLAATELNLGSVYTISPTLAFMVPEVKARAKIAPEHIPLCAILAGYTDDTSPHTERGTGKNVNYVS